MGGMAIDDFITKKGSFQGNDDCYGPYSVIFSCFISISPIFWVDFNQEPPSSIIKGKKYMVIKVILLSFLAIYNLCFLEEICQFKG
jgi:hypothetical protein